eukprot:symbB.v1.2.018357.t1/scaffold1457.1/size117646/15
MQHLLRYKTRQFATLAASVAAVSAASVVFTETRSFTTVPLLGGPKTWHFGKWRAITDQVRGGVSTAQLLPWEKEGCCGARFTGTLDPSKLSAGFAGMNLDVKYLDVKESNLHGLQLEISDTDGREYTLLLKLKGAESGSSYQVRWVPVKQSSFEAPFNKFSAYRRGRPDPEAPPLDPSEIEILAIQIASNFTQQSGNFQLDLKSINGLADGQASEI